MASPRPERASSPQTYAEPRLVTDVESCGFYHAMSLPGHGEIPGEFDLRGRVDAYLGRVDFRGRRVLEIGTADGFLCFEMERRGATVVACDLAPDDDWDLVPFAGDPHPGFRAARRERVRRLNNAFWLCHRVHASSARLVHTSAYAVPAAIGTVDVATFGCVLLHLRDPFAALARVAPMTVEAIVVTEPAHGWARHGLHPALASMAFVALKRAAARAPAWLREPPVMRFLPGVRRGEPMETWWGLGPSVVCRFLEVLGFGDTTVTWHAQRFGSGEWLTFTVVGRKG